MQQLLQSFQRRLSNISGNNRSLLLLRLFSNQFIDLHDFDQVDGRPSFNLLEQIIGGSKIIKLSAAIDSRDPDTNKLNTRLRNLRRRVQFISEETGAFDLYVGWPFVHGKFSDGSLVRAPLLFFPMKLTLEDNQWSLSPRAEVNVSLNKSFLLAYAHFNNISFPEELIERSFDDFDSDSRIFRTSLYELLKESELELNFNQDLFTDELIAFKSFKKSDFKAEQKDGRLKLYSEAVLGVFPQADSYLIPDYDYLIEQNQFNSLDDFFTERTTIGEDKLKGNSPDFTYFLNKVKEEQTFTPFPIDAYQENAIKAAKRGYSLVVQGPPGTGKSQLICNLISDFVSRGKKVLVVCQKRAALDVVYARLNEIKLTDFVALIHDFKNDRKELYDKIESQIDRLSEYQRRNNNLDSIQLERDFQLSSRTIDQVTEELEAYRTALFDESDCGISVKELYLSSSPSAESIDLTQEYHDLPIVQNKPFEKVLSRFIKYAQDINHPDHPWAERVSFSEFKMADLQKMKDYLSEIPDYVDELTGRISKIVDEDIDYHSCRALSENLDKLELLAKTLKTDEVYEYFKSMISFSNELTEPLWLENTRNQINNCFDEIGVESSIPTNEVGEIQEILRSRSNAKKNFPNSIKWYFSKEKTRLARVLVANNLKDDQEGLGQLTQRLDNRLNLQHQLTKLKSADWLTGIPKSQEQETINDWFIKIDQALSAKLLFAGFANFTEYFNLEKLGLQEFKDKLKLLIDGLAALPGQRKLWNRYVLPRQIDQLLLSEDYYQQLNSSLLKDFDAICEVDAMEATFSDSQKGVIRKLRELGDRSTEDFLAIFQNSIRLAWINHIESKHEILRSASTLKFDQIVEDLQSAVDKKLECSNEILLQKAREKTYEPVEYNRLNNRTTYRDLNHQVSKKRQVWPVRRLISHFSDELFNLMPCWMASPESVSALFPMENLFDLVIFDEASQCFSEKGLPAMFRAKQVVVTGDNKQLRPNDLYKVKWEEETEGLDFEVESVLELCSGHLMDIGLWGHYRSHSPDLINFSNQHFYRGKLSMTPHFDRLSDHSPGIEYVKVDGRWENQSNEVEADEVVKLTKTLLDKLPEKSIAILTFNVAQQYLIYDKLENAGVELGQNLFVKNIENVQGDERDIVIFSVGYGPDLDGKVNAQFGSLNLPGGENRLNVAITRAREKAFLITSIWPEELNTANSKNEGPKLLKAYLSYAKAVSDGTYALQKREFDGKNSGWYLGQQLQKWQADFGVDFVEELPFADLTVKSGSTYKSLVLTDDDLYFTSPSEKEMFVYRPKTFANKGWKFRLFHSRNFWLHPEKVKENMGRFLEKDINT